MISSAANDHTHIDECHTLKNTYQKSKNEDKKEPLSLKRVETNSILAFSEGINVGGIWKTFVQRSKDLNSSLYIHFEC